MSTEDRKRSWWRWKGRTYMIPPSLGSGPKCTSLDVFISLVTSRSSLDFLSTTITAMAFNVSITAAPIKLPVIVFLRTMLFLAFLADEIAFTHSFAFAPVSARITSLLYSFVVNVTSNTRSAPVLSISSLAGAFFVQKCASLIVFSG